MNADQLRAVQAILRHDDTSTAAELAYYFVHELGVSPRDAWRATYQRPAIRSRAGAARRSEWDVASGE